MHADGEMHRSIDAEREVLMVLQICSYSLLDGRFHDLGIEAHTSRLYFLR